MNEYDGMTYFEWLAQYELEEADRERRRQQLVHLVTALVRIAVRSA